MERALHDAVLALQHRGICRGRRHTTKNHLPGLRYWGPGSGGRCVLMLNHVEVVVAAVAVVGRWCVGADGVSRPARWGERITRVFISHKCDVRTARACSVGKHSPKECKLINNTMHTIACGYSVAQ